VQAKDGNQSLFLKSEERDLSRFFNQF